MGLFDKEYVDTPPEKLPTLRQLIKTLPSNSKKLEQILTVDIIWLPGKFDNFTLQTHLFRYGVNEKNPLYADLYEVLKNEKGFNSVGCLGIRVCNREPITIKLQPKKSIKGTWEELGKTGLRFKLN